MSQLAKLAGKEKEIEIDGIKIKIKPLSVSDLVFFEKESTKKENTTSEEDLRLVKDIIKKSIEGVTDEEVGNLNMEQILKLQEVIMGINNIKTKPKPSAKPETKEEVLADIKKEQDAQSA